MANYQLAVEERALTGKGYARKLRAEGKVPAVIYGSGKEATSIQVVAREVEKALAATGSLIDLDVAGTKKTVLVKEMHRDPVRATLLHVDFHEIDLTKKLEVTVPIRVVGEEQRTNDGGVVQTLLWEVQVLCLPTDIPDAIEVDVSGLGLEHSITLAEMQLPSGVEVLGEPDEAVVKIGMPQQANAGAEDGDEAAEDGEPAEAAEDSAGSDE